MKENKKYPYHKARALRLGGNIIMKPKYALVTDKGKIIEKFRLQNTAQNELPNYQKKYQEKLKIVVI